MTKSLSAPQRRYPILELLQGDGQAAIHQAAAVVHALRGAVQEFGYLVGIREAQAHQGHDAQVGVQVGFVFQLNLLVGQEQRVQVCHKGGKKEEEHLVERAVEALQFALHHGVRGEEVVQVLQLPGLQLAAHR